MKKLVTTLVAAVAVALPALSVRADDSKITKGYNTYDSMGCMLTRECTDGVQEVVSLLDISSEYPNTDDFYFVTDEFNNILFTLREIGVGVFLAPSKYFPPGHRGVYHTVGNNLFLNRDYMGEPVS